MRRPNPLYSTRLNFEPLEIRSLLSAAGLQTSLADQAVAAVAEATFTPIVSRGQLFASAPVVSQLATTPHQTTSTITTNGDLNPYGVAFVPENFVGGGRIHSGDILVSNFNNSANLQGTGTTIVRVTPSGQASTFFQGPAGLGLSTALGVLSRGFVVVGSVPTTDGTGATASQGSLTILDKYGLQVATFSNGAVFDGPWDLTIHDEGSRAQVFVSNVLSGTVTRLDLHVGFHGVTVTGVTQIASGYAHRTDPAALLLGPTGLLYDAKKDLLYVASTADNEIFAIAHAKATHQDVGRGTVVYQDSVHLHGPLGLAWDPNGDLIVANGDAVNADTTHPSELVEFTPTGKFVAQFSLDPVVDAAFGIATVADDGQTRFAAVNDNHNTVEVWTLGKPDKSSQTMDGNNRLQFSNAAGANNAAAPTIAPSSAMNFAPSSQAAAATSGGFTVSPSPQLSQSNELRAVAAFSATDAWAVGDQSPNSTLIEHWTGSKWTVVATPNLGMSWNLLNGVVDLGPSNAWAVGQALVGSSYVPLIEHWTGTRWTVVSSPSMAGGDNVLNAVTAVSASNIWAAGWHRDSASATIQPLTEHWDGTKWSIVPSPALPGSPSLFFGIAAASSNDIWAVGRTGHKASQLIEHWDGANWTVVATPPVPYSVVYSATVISTKDVWAVGETASSTLTEHWDGRNWTIVSSPNGSGAFQSVLTGVSATSSNQVWAVGFSGNGSPGQPLIEQWNGRGWTVVASPNPGGLTDGLRGVAALPSGRVWTVGSFSNLNGNQPGPDQSLILVKAAGTSAASTAQVTPAFSPAISQPAAAPDGQTVSSAGGSSLSMASNTLPSGSRAMATGRSRLGRAVDLVLSEF